MRSAHLLVIGTEGRQYVSSYVHKSAIVTVTLAGVAELIGVRRSLLRRDPTPERGRLARRFWVPFGGSTRLIDRSRYSAVRLMGALYTER